LAIFEVAGQGVGEFEGGNDGFAQSMPACALWLS
jgi:hypothetical protein